MHIKYLRGKSKSVLIIRKLVKKLKWTVRRTLSQKVKWIMSNLQLLIQSDVGEMVYARYLLCKHS